MELGKAIRELRKQFGYSQRDLASLLECNYTYISKIENGNSDYPPSETMLKNLALIFGVSEEWLIFKSGRIPSTYAGLLADLALKHGENLPELLKNLL